MAGYYVTNLIFKLYKQGYLRAGFIITIINKKV